MSGSGMSLNVCVLVKMSAELIWNDIQIQGSLTKIWYKILANEKRCYMHDVSYLLGTFSVIGGTHTMILDRSVLR